MKKFFKWVASLTAMLVLAACGQQPTSFSLFNANLANTTWVKSEGDVFNEEGYLVYDAVYDKEGNTTSETYTTVPLGTDETTLFLKKDGTFTIETLYKCIPAGTVLKFEEKEDKGGNVTHAVDPDGLKIYNVTLKEKTTYTIKGDAFNSKEGLSGTWFSYKTPLAEQVYAITAEKHTITNYDLSTVYDDTSHVFDFSKRKVKVSETESVPEAYAKYEIFPGNNYRVVKKGGETQLIISVPDMDFANGTYTKTKNKK